MQALQDTSVLITGGVGFVGSHLAETLLQRGCQVTLVDDLSTGRWSNLASFEHHPNLRVIIADAGDRALMEEEIKAHQVVFHLASAVGVKLIIEKPVKTVETIFHTTDVVLKACSRYRRPIVITSTSEVYGKSTDVPFREEADVVMGPTSKRRWAYACAKALDEFLALAHYYETHLPVFLVRLFNTVGPRQTGQYGMVIPNFISQALQGQPLTVYGDGQQRRCFCSVKDVVQGLIRLPLAKDAAGKVINLGSQEEISILDLARKVIHLTASSSNPVFIPYEQAYGAGFDDMLRRIPDLSRAQEYLGWTPSRSLDSIILEVAASLRGPSAS